MKQGNSYQQDWMLGLRTRSQPRHRTQHPTRQGFAEPVVATIPNRECRSASQVHCIGWPQDDIGVLKGNTVSRTTRDHAETIPSLLALEYVNILIRSDLIALLRQISDIDKGHRLSFYRADLMLQAVDANGPTYYVTVEASCPADQRDTNRALRNAEYLQRCTGCPAHAVIASIKNDREVQLLVEDGTVHWLQLTCDDLDPA